MDPTINETHPDRDLLIHIPKTYLYILLLVIICIIYALSNLYIKHIPKPGAPQRVVVKPVSAATFFTVEGISPNNGSNDNEQDAPITLTFSQPVRPDSLRDYFTVSPMIPGTFTKGYTANQVVYTPKYPFGYNTSVKVILNKGLQSISGDKLPTDFTYNFFTRTEDDSVLFLNQYVYSHWENIPVGGKIDFTIRAGRDVSQNSTITIYKGTFDRIVSALLYKNASHDDSNYLTQNFLDYPVDTAQMPRVSVSNGIENGQSYTFNQGEGLYYIEAKNDGKRVGFTWVNVTDEGLIVRQDDQKVTVATQNVKSGDISGKVKILLFNVENKPTLLGVKEIEGVGEIPVPFSPKVDLVVGQTPNGVILAPLTIPESQADIRMTSDLSKLGKIFLTTDKPSYASQEAVRFSGIVRHDNDAKYTLPDTNEKVRVWIKDPQDDAKKIVDQTVSVDQHGVFSGQFIVPDSVIPELQWQSTDTAFEVTVYADIVSEGKQYINSRSYTTFNLVKASSDARITVSFDKNEYTKDEKITAHITGVDAAGKPLANLPVTYSVLAKNYYENDPSSKANFGTEWGSPIDTVDQPINLDENGKADVSLNQNNISVSEEMSLRVVGIVENKEVAGAKTVLVHQGKLYFDFGISRQSYKSGEPIITRAYVKDLNGTVKANFPVHYQLYNSSYSSSNYAENIYAEGDTKSDDKGLILIKQPVTLTDATITIRISGKDENGNEVQAEKTVNINNDYVSLNVYLHDLRLSNFDVTTDKISYNIGDTANLVITSPFNQNVLVTYESGRIYHNEWIKLQKGDNTYKVPIDAQLAPSFNVVFSYFYNGLLQIEGLPINVNDSSKNLQVTVSYDKSTYTKSDSPQLKITTTDSNGQPVQASVLIDVLDDSIFGLHDVIPNGNLNWFYYKPRDIMTNFSASTLGIGTGGGCGGGGGVDIKVYPNRLGNVIYWNPNVKTDVTGNASISFPLTNANGTAKVLINAVSDTTAVGQVTSIFSIL